MERIKHRDGVYSFKRTGPEDDVSSVTREQLLAAGWSRRLIDLLDIKDLVGDRYHRPDTAPAG